MSILQLTINGKKIDPIEVPEEVTMIEYLHEYRNLTGTKFGCGQGTCNACVVIVDNDDGTKELKKTCINSTSVFNNKKIRTIEGLATKDKNNNIIGLNPVQEAFMEQFSFQCGWCTSGFVNAATVLIEELKQKHNSFPRNPILADVFFKGGLIESWGRGTIKIINECKLAGLPQPEIEEMNGGIVVTLFKNIIQTEHQQKEKGLSERQNRAIDYVKKNSRITNKEYQELNNISERTASRDIRELIKMGFLRNSGTKGAGAFYTLK